MVASSGRGAWQDWQRQSKRSRSSSSAVPASFMALNQRQTVRSLTPWATASSRTSTVVSPKATKET